MGKPPFRPLNLSQAEIDVIHAVLNETLGQTNFNTKALAGSVALQHILNKLERLKL